MAAAYKTGRSPYFGIGPVGLNNPVRFRVSAFFGKRRPWRMRVILRAVA